MNKFTKDIIESLLSEATEGITVMLPGGFKPPHEGHLMLAKGYEELPQVEKVIILIGPKDRDGITVRDSKAIWKALLAGTPNIEVRESKYPSPLLTAYKFIENDAKEGEVIALGSSSKGSDYDRIRSFVDQHQEGGKYYKPGVSVVELPLEQSNPIIYKGRTDDENGKPMSASQLRADLAANDFENFKANYPSIKSTQQLQTIFDMLVKKKTNEGGASLFRSTMNEDATLLLRKQFEGLKNKFGAFIDKLKQENRETKEAFQKLVNAVKTGEKLDKSEKKEIGNQMKDVLKLAGFTAASVLPGGIIYLLLSRVPALKKHMTPSSFLAEGRIPLNEGGAAGHMAHPYEDMDLTFDEAEDMIDATLSGKVDYAQEKLDGQNLMATYKDGEVRIARNKGQLKNAGENSLTKTAFEKTMQHLPDNVRNAFLEAHQDLMDAIDKLTPAEKEDIFNNGSNFINLEVLHPSSENVAPYGVTQLRIHNIQQYDEDGNVVGTENSQKMQSALDRAQAGNQGTYEIRQTDLVSLKQTKDYEKQKEELTKELNKLRSRYNLRKDDKIGMYFQNWWTDYVKNNAKTYGYDVPADVLQNIVNRWGFGSKEPNLRILKSSIDNSEFLQWFSETDKGSVVRQQKKIAVEPLEDIFLKLGVFVLKSMEGLLAVNPNQSIQKMKTSLADSIDKINALVKNNKMSDDDAPMHFLKAQLKRLEKIGGYDAILPTEGVVFKHKGKLYKLTGAFAPINQIIGYIKFAR
jgi:hypothetical protein